MNTPAAIEVTISRPPEQGRNGLFGEEVLVMKWCVLDHGRPAFSLNSVAARRIATGISAIQGSQTEAVSLFLLCALSSG